MKTERDLFKQAYLNLRTADSIPFPDAVFDEYVRLRDSEGYKLVPVLPTLKMVRASENIKSSKTIRQDIYKAMLGVVE